MDKIITTQVRLFLRQTHNMPPIEDCLPLLFNSDRGSYFVPQHIRENQVDPYIDIQYGARNYPAGVMRLWKEFHEYFDSIWVRFFYESADHDMIFSVNDEGKSDDFSCLYSFDHMRVTWKANDAPPETLARQTGLNWMIRDDVWGLNIHGSYLAANFRGEVCHGNNRLRPGIDSPTTAACLMDGGLKWDFYHIQPHQLIEFVQLYKANLKKIEFYYQRRLVRAEIIYPQNNGWDWHFFSIDDWDNCIDADYILYNEFHYENER